MDFPPQPIWSGVPRPEVRRARAGSSAPPGARPMSNTAERVSAIVDVDDQRSWPDDVAAWVAALAREVVVTESPYASDITLPAYDEDGFRALFAERKLRAYHCT